MEFSLPLLLEKGSFSTETYTMNIFSDTDKYSDIQLLPTDESFCISHTLYMTSALEQPLTDTDTSSFIMESLKELSLKLHFRVGISDIFQGFEPIPTCYKQAEYALQLTTIQTYDSVLLYNNCALNHLQQGLESSTCKCFYPIGLDILKQYDQKNHTDLLFTLKVYLENERNVIKTAELLFIHRNTLSYRIKKIQDLCRFNLENSKLRLRLLFSLQEISS